MTQPDPRALLDHLDALHGGGTSGEWRWDPEYGTAGDTGLALTNDAEDEIVGAYNYHCCEFRIDPHVNAADAALIAAAVNALPQLTAALRAALAYSDRIDDDADMWEGLVSGWREVGFETDAKRCIALGDEDRKHAAGLRDAIVDALTPAQATTEAPA